MDAQDFRSLQEAYIGVYEQEITLKGTGPRLVDPYADSGESKSGGKMKGPKMKNIIKKEETEIYDIILSHLLDEGYAETQEAAERIMVNMSEDWRESIVEGDNYDKNRQRAAKRAAERNEARKRGQTGSVPGIGYVSPRPERETYRDAAGVERHTSGARMFQK